MVKSLHANAGDPGSWVWKDPLEKGMATRSNIFAWRIPWTEELGELPLMEFQQLSTPTHGLKVKGMEQL